MKILVCGGRDYNNYTFVEAALDKLHKEKGITLLIHGAARGADTLADMWAEKNRVARQPCPADWDKHGNSAGPIRNRDMLRDWEPRGVVAFPGGNGTDDMVRAARSAGVGVWDLRKKGN